MILSWLSGPQVPRIFGPYEPIRRDYTTEEFKSDIASSHVVQSVYVQTNWPAGQSLADRRLYDSNFPIEKLWTDYASLYRTFREAIEPFTEAEQRKILHEAAMRLYRRPVQRSGMISSHAILGGLHHQYVRI